MTIISALLYLGFGIAVCCLLSSILNYWYPALALSDDFLMFELVGIGFLVGMAFVVSDKLPILLLLVIFCLLSLRLLPTLLTVAQRDSTKARFLRLITFNVQKMQIGPDPIAKFISTSGADLVILQEVDRQGVSEITRCLCGVYPHVVYAGGPNNYGVALFARDTCDTMGFVDGTERNPDLVWGRFRRGNIAYEMIGVYFADPFHPYKQRQHILWLTDYCGARPGALIVAGDFNMTPFSTKLIKFALATGLRRHATFLTSWPAGALTSAFLIDHLFSTQEFVVIKTSVGPSLGSDHFAVIGDVGLADNAKRTERLETRKRSASRDAALSSFSAPPS